MPPQHEVQRPLPAVTPVGRAHGGNVRSVRPGGEPVEHLGADRPAALTAVGRFARPGPPRDQQHDSRAHRLGLRKPLVEPGVRGIERVAVEIERELRRDGAAAELAVPG